jgi:hypothetical protein
MFKFLFVIGWLLASGGSSLAWSEDLVVGLGQPLDEAEIRRFSITQFPDGRNLPPGSGTAEQGMTLFEERCALCHGSDGTDGPAARLAGADGFFSLTDPLRILRIRKFPLLVLSVGAQWPYATTIFDYTRRAMPHFAPKSLTDPEVYALTAYILYLNDLVEKSTVMDRNSLPRVTMPGKARTVLAWPPADSP